LWYIDGAIQHIGRIDPGEDASIGSHYSETRLPLLVKAFSGKFTVFRQTSPVSLDGRMPVQAGTDVAGSST
jgi:hypothetical protein